MALGESVHTSGGFSRLKFRIFRYLVEEMGFRAFAFESSWEPAESVAHYVQTCEGRPERALRGLFGVWQNESVRDLVKWMCVWNKRHPNDRVFFLGFDEQQPALDYAALRDFLELFGLPRSDPRVRGIERCSKKLELEIAREDFDECLKRLDQIERYFDRRQASIIRRTSAEDLEWARLRLVGLRAWQEQIFYQPRDIRQSIAARDAAMAYIFLKRRELQFPDVKTAIWAHNFHIDEGSAQRFGLPTMGSHLAEALGADYVTLALIGYRVSIDWPGQGCGEVPPPTQSNSVEVLLHDLGEPYLFVDLDFRGSSNRFLEDGQDYWISEALVVPGDHYDGVFFLDVAQKMKPLAWYPCQ